jgi:hypothetical protein
MQMKSARKDIHIPLIAIVPRVTNRGAVDNNPCDACHQVDDRCHRLGRLNYAMIIVEQNDEGYPS